MGLRNKKQSEGTLFRLWLKVTSGRSGEAKAKVVPCFPVGSVGGLFASLHNDTVGKMFNYSVVEGLWGN